MNNFTKRISTLVFFIFCTFNVLFAQKYWRGGSGNWSDATHWSSTPLVFTATTVPTSADNVFFDGSSFSSAGQTVTLDVAGACNNMDWTGSTNTPTFNMSSNPLTINGNIINFIGGMSLTNPQPITFTNTGNITIETGGATKTFSDLTFTGTASRTINIDISSGGTKGFGVVTVGDNSTININNNGSYKGMSLGNSTTSSLTIVGAFYGPVSMGTNTTANWSCLSQFNNSVTVSGTSVAGVNFANATYGSTNNITGKYTSAYSAFNTGSFSTFTGGNTNITTCIIQAGTAVIFKNNGTVTGNLFQDITMGAGSTINFPTGGSTSTVSGTVSTAGLCSNPVNINSDNGSSPAKVKFGTFSNPNNININNIDNTGGAAVNILSGTGANNINITVKDGTTAATGRTLYWVGGTGNWSGVCSHWATSSGGSNLTSAPTQYDNVIFDNNSFPAAGQTVTLDVAGACNNMDWTGSTNTPTFNMSSNSLTVNGNTLTFIGLMNILNPQPITFTNTGNITIETGGATKTFSDLTFTGTASRTINIDISSGGTKGFGIVTVGDNSTINVGNNGSYTGIILGNTVPSTFSGNVTVSGIVTMGTGATANWTGISKFNGPVTVNASPNISFDNATFFATNNINAKYNSITTNINGGITNFKSGILSITNLTTGSGATINSTNSSSSISNITMAAGSNINFSTSGTTNISGNFITNGTCLAPVGINSVAGPTQAKININLFPNISNVNISNIDNSGGAPVTILSGVGGNNINIIIKDGSSAASGRTLYWVGGTGNWSTSGCTHWATSSGGVDLTSAPTSFDNVIFDAVSFTGAGQSINLDVIGNVNNMDWSNASNNPQFKITQPLTINGNFLKLSTATMSIGAGPQPINFTNTSNITVEMGVSGKTLGNLSFTGAGSLININNSSTGTHNFGNLTVANNANFNIKSSGSNTYKAINFGISSTSVFVDNPSFTSATFNDNSNLTVNGNLSATGAFTFKNGTTSTFNGSVNFGNTLSFGNNSISNSSGTGSFTKNVSFGSGTSATWSGSNVFNGKLSILGTSGAGFNITNADFNIGGNTITGLFKSTGIINLKLGISTFSGSAGTANNSFNTLNIRNSGTTLTLLNTGNNNTFNTINTDPATFINFNSGVGGTKITNFFPTANCSPASNLFTIDSDNGSSQANVDFGNWPAANRNNVSIKDINNTNASVVTILTSPNIGINNTKIIVNGPSASSRNLYWIGGTGNWSDCTHWSTVSGVNVGGVAQPTFLDNVFFDGGSFNSAGQSVILDPAATSSCNNMDWTGSTNTPTFNMSSNPLTINGNTLTFIGLMNILNPQPITFTNTGNITIETGGATKTFSDLTFTGTASRTINIDISSGGTKGFGVVTVGDNSTININNNGSYKGMSLGNSTTSSLTIVGAFYGPVSMGTNTTANWSCLSQFNNSVTVSGTSVAGVNFANATYGSTNNITGKYTSAYSAFNTGSFSTFTGGNTNITTCIIQAGTAVIFKNNGTVTGNLFQDITMGAGSTINFPTGGSTSTVSGTVSTAGLCSNPVNINSDNGSSRAKVKFGTFSNPNNININNIDNTGGAAVNILSGTGANNINITVKDGTTAATGRTLYWVGGTGNWSDCTHWSSLSGGSTNVPAPISFDNVIFDNNSFSALGQVVNVDLNTSSCNNLTWKNTVTNSPNINFNNATILNINGSMTLDASLGAVTDPSNTGYFNFISTTAQNITTAGKTLPQVQFNNSGAWTMLDAMTVTRRVAVLTGTLKTNGQTLTCNDFNSNSGNTRSVDMGNSKFIITGNQNFIVDLRNDNNLTWITPGVTAKIQMTNGTSYMSLDWGGNTKEIPDILFESIPTSTTIGPNDIDMYVDGGNSRITFRSIKISNTTGSQFYISGNNPLTFLGNLTFPDNLNQNPPGQVFIQGTSNPAPGNNIFNGTVTFGTSSAFSFLGDNTFNNSFTIASTNDLDKAIDFQRNNVFNGTVDITATNSNRVNPTIEFNSNSGSVSFNNNATLRGVNALYRFSGGGNQMVGKNLTFDNDSRALFMGGNGNTALGVPIPGSGAYNMSGNIILNKRVVIDFRNDNDNIYNNLTTGNYSTFNFTASNNHLSTVTGTFTLAGNCSVWTIIGSSTNGTQARVTFQIVQNWQSTIVNDLNVIPGSQLVTVIGGVDNNNIIVSPNPGFTLKFTPGSTPTLYWVGGNPTNVSGNNNWSDPRNWATDITNATLVKNGGGCIPDATTVVVFEGRSFSYGASASSKSPAQLSQVLINIPNANCQDMIWQDGANAVNINTSGSGVKPSIQTNSQLYNLNVYGRLELAPNTMMQNNFNGTFIFKSNTIVTIDANGSALPSTSLGTSTRFNGPIVFSNSTGNWRLESDIVVNGDALGNITLDIGSVTCVSAGGHSCNITLDGNWTVRPQITQPTFDPGVGTVTFNGQNSNTGSQFIVSGAHQAGNTNYFYDLVINRQSVGDTRAGNGGSYGANSDVVVSNRYGTNGNPGQNTNNNQPFNSGLKVIHNLSILNGNLWDRGYQIIGNKNNQLIINATGALHIGDPSSYSGLNNDNPLTTVFPTNFVRSNIALATGSIVAYKAQGNQDVSTEPIYSNLYLGNPNQCNATILTGLETLGGPCSRKRLVMPNTKLGNFNSLNVFDNLTLETGIILADNGFQITGVTNRSSLTIQKGGALLIGSGNQTIAATIGDSTNYNPLLNQNGTYSTLPASTVFPLNFDDSKLSLDPKSIIVYQSSLAQNIRGLNTLPAQYGHLISAVPTTVASIIPKTLQAASTIRGYLIIDPNANFIDNGNQITGTTGQQFAMNYNIGNTLTGFFNNQTPYSSGSTSSLVSTNYSQTTPFTIPTNPNPFNNATINNFGVVFQGYINISTAGNHTFFTASDDGSNLYIDGIQVVNNDYYQGVTERSGIINLTTGLHKILISYFQGNGGYGLNVRWQGPSTGGSKVDIPNTVLLTQNKTANSIDYLYYESLTLTGQDQTNLNTRSILKNLTDLSSQPVTSILTLSGLSQMVIGTGSASTLFPLNYSNTTDINLDRGTAIVYNGGVNLQPVFGLTGSLFQQQYSSLILTNPISSTVLSKPINTSSGIMVIRDSLIINPNNNLIDNGTQISGSINQNFRMRNATKSSNPVTNTGAIGMTGESRITLGTAAISTLFPLNYNLTNGTDISFQSGTTVVYNSGKVQPVAGVQGANNGSYANLMLTNPTNVNPTLALKTLQNNAITIRGYLSINPNNIFADGGYQVSGILGQSFNMFNTTLPQDPVTNTNIGTFGESRYVVGSDGTSTKFPLNYRFGSPSDIKFELNTTIVYNAKSTQIVQGLAGIGNSTYANLTLTNPDASAVILVKKYLTNNGTVTTGTTIRNTLTINPNNNFIDNGLQITGTANQKFYMYGATSATNPLGTSPSNVGTTGTSQLSLGTNLIATGFPLNFITKANSSPTDINFESGTTVAYCSGINQSIQGVINTASLTTNNNYYNVILADSTSTFATKTIVGSDMRIRGDLTIGGYNNLDVSINNFNIFIQGNWIGTNTGATGSKFTSRNSLVTFEGGNAQTLTHNNSIANALLPTPEAQQDFYKIEINKIPSNKVTLNSLVAASKDIKFNSGYIKSGTLTSFASVNTAPSNLLIFRDGVTATSPSNLSHTIGAVRKIGMDNFTFPIGTGPNGEIPGVINGPVYRPDGISGLTNNTTSFITQYFPQSPKSAGFPQNLRQNPPLARVSGVEFWMINRETGSSNAYVTLSWNDAYSGPGFSGGTAFAGVGNNGNPASYLDLRVARWNSVQWRDMGGGTYNGNNQIGGLTSTLNTSSASGPVDNFSPFTLGSITVFNPLPVTLVNFEAVPVNNKVDLKWNTSYEENTKNFIIEKSSDGKNFIFMTSVNAKGNSSVNLDYYSVDEKPFNGTSYYRLKIIDFDGVESYSKQVAVRMDGLDIDKITLYPNPTEGYNINFDYNTPFTLSQIVDMTGKNVQYKVIEILDNKMKVDFLERLTAGTYIALLISEDGKHLRKIKFIVN